MKKQKAIFIFLAFFNLILISRLSADEVKNTMSEKNNQNSKNYICDTGFTDEYLRRNLTPEQYRVTRQNATELPFKNTYWDNKKPGIYVDVISGEPLFSSTDKFDSGTGWPSFIKPIEKENIVEKPDKTHGMTRIEARSKKSDSHLGHVFDDGPKPTGLRYCINSASLRFIPLEDLEKQGYGKYLYLFEKDTATTPKTQIAVFGAGCFWGVEAAFSELKGVIKTTSGFMGGTLKNPTYEDVCTNKTGHAEVVWVEFDPAQVSYEKLLDIFWSIHDPTTINRQGPDVDSQYRSVIFYFTPEQAKLAIASKGKLNKTKFKGKITTKILPAPEFYKAEEYHQEYYKKKGIKPVCHIPFGNK